MTTENDVGTNSWVEESNSDEPTPTLTSTTPVSSPLPSRRNKTAAVIPADDETNNPFADDDDDEDDEDIRDDEFGDDERQGTISSARFNILSTMVGGGSLSLPLAFQKSGNALLAPLCLIFAALVTDFCFRILVDSGERPQNPRVRGKNTLQSVAARAIGAKGNAFSIALVTAMCFFGTLGYCVLLRDMLQPIADLIAPSEFKGSRTAYNATLLLVVILVTPLCTLRTLTALKRFGALSMLSVFILGCCVIYRSIECNFAPDQPRHSEWYEYLRLFPKSWKGVLDALPLYISCYVCHYNILPVHNELRNPTQVRTSWWLRSTAWSATIFYLFIGFGGSMYGNCTPSGTVQGNVLLDFHEDDPLLLMGRMCLALTITLAFPMLVIPARDILLQVRDEIVKRSSGEEVEDDNEEEYPTVSARLPSNWASSDVVTSSRSPNDSALQEPLLTDEERPDADINGMGDQEFEDGTLQESTFLERLLYSAMVFWLGAAVACSVSSIDIVWDLLGSSLSIFLSYSIPCYSYLVIADQRELDLAFDYEAGSEWKRSMSRRICWGLLLTTTPMMFISTGNAVYNIFFQ